MMDIDNDTTVRRILIIDDNPEIFNDFKTILNGIIDHSNLDAMSKQLFGHRQEKELPRNTYDLHYANQGKEGFETAKAAKEKGNHFHLAFVDMRMPPGWDGLETIQHLWRADPELQVVICTAYSDHSWQDITLKLGKTDKLLLLKKPFDSVEVSQIAAAMTEKWLLSRQAKLKMEELEQLVESRTRELEEANRRELQVQKQQSLNVLAGSIAHNFNNSLAIILGNLEMTLFDLPQDSPFRSFLKSAEEAAQTAAELSTAMLTYTGQWKGNLKAMDLSASIQDMQLLLCVTMPDHITGTFHLPESLPRIQGIPGQLKQVMMNLVSNAVEAIGKPGGEIRVSTEAVTCDEDFFRDFHITGEHKPGVYICLEVRDNGCGMDEEVIRNIFDPYFTTKFTGRGMGMAAVMGILKKHNAAIQISSEPQKGTSVKIYFPTLTEDQKKITPPTGRDDKIIWKGKGTILLVDDEPMVLEVAKAILKQLGFQVITADSGEKAVHLFKQHLRDNEPIHMVMLDVSMPGIGGVAAFEQIRDMKEDIPTIMFSGFNQEQLESKLAHQENVEFLQKPFRVVQLKSIIMKILPEPSASGGSPRAKGRLPLEPR